MILDRRQTPGQRFVFIFAVLLKTEDKRHILLIYYVVTLETLVKNPVT